MNTFLLILVFAVSNANAIEEFKITASDAHANDEFGTSVAISGDYAIVGSPRNDDDGDRSGSAYIFVRDDWEWTEQAKLTASDADSGDFFGRSLSISGDYAIVSAYRNGDNGELSGSAYIFARDGEEWTEQAKLTASDADAYDYFGWRVSISGDYAIVGAYGNDDGRHDSGSAYIFVRNGDNWVEQAKITAHDAGIEDYFGGAVSISGNYAIIGAEGDSDFGISSGSAYIFVRDGDEWHEQAKLNADDAYEIDIFGFAVSINGDYAIVGAYLNDSNGWDSGSAYVFIRDGEEWTQQAKLNASDAGSFDYFGYSVSISGDYAIVGAHGNNYNGGEYFGSAYIFVRDGEEWSETGKIVASDIGSDDGFGYFVSNYDNYAIVGSPGDCDDGEFSGSAYIYSGLDSLAVPDFGWNEAAFPNGFFLSPAYPNPFNSTTSISYELVKPCRISIRIYDVDGRLMTTLIDNEGTPGRYRTTWNGHGMASGVYVVRMNVSGDVLSHKVVLLK
ncbi:MAG: T9SS type A sorting domain-containing protein [Calditrichaeota bacterium]|nr:T9SS type A sorting domain-containing protein [Calditrichota bacterium]